jgi:outer membrane receptor protein involved in Fe transport
MRYLGRILVALAVCALLAGTVGAQTTRGDIAGRVVDDNNLPLPGVTVIIESNAMTASRNTITDADGGYRFLSLPPGEYKVTFSMPSFQTRVQENMRVSMGVTTKVDAQMTGAFTEEVLVTSETPLVDTSQTTLGVDISNEFYKDLPVGRNYSAVAGVAPGAQADDSGQTFYGSTGAENSYYIDGANTSNVEFGTQGKNLNFEFIDEIQVKTGSYNAEYGRATGSVINVVTKSGGNDFHGDVFGYFDSADLQASLSSEAARGPISGSFVQTEFQRIDYGFDLGGRIVRDKLWFFVAYDVVDNENTLSVLKDFSDVIEGGSFEGQEVPETTDSDLWAAKLTWSAAANHSLSLSAFADPTDQSGYTAAAGTSLAATALAYTGINELGGTDYALNYDAIFGENLVLTIRGAQHNEKNKLAGPGTETVGYVDFTDPLGDGTTVWGWDADSNAHQRVSGFGFHNSNEFGRDQYNVDVSYFLDDAAGSHELKVGFEWEDLTIDAENWNGGAGQRIYRFPCDPADRYCGENGEAEYYFRHRFYVPNTDVDVEDLTLDDALIPFPVNTKSDSAAAYIQDQWQVTGNLSLSLGLRWTQQRLYNGDREVHHTIDDNFAPRIGFVWDALGNGKSKVFAHWGKFYESIPMDIVIRSFGGEITAWNYNLSDDPNDVAANLDVRSTRFLGGGFSRVDPGTKGQHLEETVVGFEYEFAPDYAVGVKYVYRDLKSVIEDALSADGDYFIGNPSEGLMEGTYALCYAYGYESCGLMPIDRPTREFEGVELTIQKRFSNNFQFLASALWSTMTGNYDGTFQASTGQLDPNLNSAFDYGDFQVNNDGHLSNDLRQQYKFDGIYRFNFGLSAGLSMYYRDGAPITAYGYSTAYNNWEFYMSERGVGYGRVDAQFEGDVHFGYPVRLGSGLELNLLLDIFSIFNQQGETLRDMQYTTAATGSTYEDGGSSVIDPNTGNPIPPLNVDDTGRPPTNPGWNTANRWQDPTTVRLGVRLSF